VWGGKGGPKGEEKYKKRCAPYESIRMVEARRWEAVLNGREGQSGTSAKIEPERLGREIIMLTKDQRGGEVPMGVGPRSKDSTTKTNKEPGTKNGGNRACWVEDKGDVDG